MYAEVWLVNYAAMPFQLLLQQLPLSWKQCWGPVQWFSQNVLKKWSLEVKSLKNGEMSGLKFSPFPPIFHSIWNRCLPRFKTIQVHKACLYRRYWCYKLWWRRFVCLIFWTKGVLHLSDIVSHISWLFNILSVSYGSCWLLSSQAHKRKDSMNTFFETYSKGCVKECRL